MLRAVTVGRDQHRGDRSNDRSRGRGGRRDRPRPWDARPGVDTPGGQSRTPLRPESTTYSEGSLPVAVAVRRRVVDDGGAGAPIEKGTNTVERVLAAESASWVDLRDRRVSCSMDVAAAMASVEPVPSLMGMAKTKAKTASAAAEIDPPPV